MRFFALLPFAALAAAAAVTPTPNLAPTIELEARVDSACTVCVPHARARGFAVGSIIDSAASNVGSAISSLTSHYKSDTSAIASAFNSSMAPWSHNAALRPMVSLGGATGVLVVGSGVLAGAWMTL